MTVSVLSAAKWLARRSGWTLSELELQKILYLAHMFCLGRTGRALVAGSFEAWDYGPIHPDLHRRIKIFGADPVQNIFHGVLDLNDGPEQQIIEEAYASLGQSKPGVLVGATQRRKGAWERNYLPGVRGVVIADDDLLTEYQGMRNAAA
jgi:uncharacterized phage-associated protein